MARLLFVVPRFHTNLFFATRTLIEAGHEVRVLAVSGAKSEDHRHVQPQVMGRDPDPREVAEALRAARPDLILLRTAPALSARVAREARRQRLRVVGYDLKPMTQLRSLRKRLSLRLRGLPWERVTPVRGLDRDAPVDHGAHYLPWPTAALPLPGGIERDQAAGPVRVLCVGKLAQVRKNQHLLIEALEALGGGAKARLTLVGSSSQSAAGADDAHYRRLLAAAERHDWIGILEDQSFAGVAELYATHHLCVLPSVGEPLGVAPVEGMAYGTIPVISTQSGSAGYVTPGMDGCRVDMDRPDALREVLAPLLEDAALRQRLSEGARHTAETELSPERFLQRIDTLMGRG